MNVYQEPKYEIKNGKIHNRQSGEQIPDDEPVFILRARDIHAAELIVLYSREVADPKHQEAVRMRAAQFNNWASLHPTRMKAPNTQMDAGWTSAGNPS